MSFWRSIKRSTVDEHPVIQPATLPTEYVEKSAQDVLFGSGNYFNNLGNKRLAEITARTITQAKKIKKNPCSQGYCRFQGSLSTSQFLSEIESSRQPKR